MASPIQFTSIACPTTIKNRYKWATSRSIIQLSTNSIHHVQKQRPEPQQLAKRLDVLIRIGSKREDQWRVRSQHESNAIPSSHSSPSLHELVNHFYGAINNKDTETLEALISDECRFEELVFYLPFDKKEKVIQFLHELMDAMGPNAKFLTESITEGENYTANAVWHLEWKQRKIPFTNGISFFEWKEKDGKLVIKKVRAMEEFPLKPGDLVLKLLKMVTTVLDRIPEPAAAGILSSSHDSQDSLLSLVLHLLGVDHKGPS